MQQSIQINTLSIDDLRGIIDESVKNGLSEYSPKETPKPQQELITEAELCKKLHRSKVTLNDWRKKGLLPFYRIARKIYYDWNEVLAALKKVEKREV